MLDLGRDLAGIEFRQQFALFYPRAEIYGEGDNISGNFRGNLSPLDCLHGADNFNLIVGDSFFHLADGNLDRLQGLRFRTSPGLFLFAAKQKHAEQYNT
ncbi:MAG: hypothetical protein ACD_75C01482G0002 [uncultured bacterium]|nr:MAG: hypothetical protein ACD_75C01482G0002 [uncultured bacterium]